MFLFNRQIGKNKSSIVINDSPLLDSPGSDEVPV